MSKLKTLLQDRQAKQAGRVCKHAVCLDADLVERRADLLAEQADLDQPIASPSLANPNDARSNQIKDELAALEAEMAESTVQIVFKSLAYAPYQRMIEDFKRPVEQPNGEVVRELDAAEFLPALAHRCFVEFRHDGVKVDDMDAADLGALLDSLPFGDADALFTKLHLLHLGETDLPKSVKRSAPTRSSDSNSTSQTDTESHPAV